MAELQTKSFKRKHRKRQTDHIKRTSLSLIGNSIIYSNKELKTMERYLQSTERKNCHLGIANLVQRSKIMVKNNFSW